MRITAVELENIKSYGERTCIELTEGLNAVCGLNGSGKTTLLEAIGWALFDFLPYPQRYFLREGQRSGTVRVRLLARDGREYEVVRKIGSGNACYVSDVELDARLADRVENVIDWIRTYALDIDGEADLASLFKNAVGVPQGLMTAVFLERESTRKTVFDPLLRVEEYGKAWEHLRDTVSYLRNLSGTVKEEIARLSSEVERIPDVRQDVEGLRDQLHRSDERLAGLVTELSELEEQKFGLDELERRLHDLSDELAGKRYDVRRHTDMLAVQEQALETAVQAERVVRETEPGYRMVLAARDRLALLEGRRAARERLEREKAEVTTQMRAIHDAIKRLDGEVLAAMSAAEEAKRLLDGVTRQDELEEQLQQKRMQTHDAAGLDEQIAALQHEVEEQESSIAARAETIEHAREALSRAERLDDAQERLRRTRDQLAALEAVQEQRAKVESEGTQLRKRYDRLLDDVTRKQGLMTRLEGLEPTAAALQGLTQHLQELREERVRVVATIEYRSVARAELEGRRCPLLDLQCPVVTEDMTRLDRLDARGRELSVRDAQLHRELSAVEEQVAAAQAAATEAQRLRIDLGPLQRSEEDLPEVEEQLDACRTLYRQLEDVLAHRKELEVERRSLEEEVKRLQEARDAANQLPLLEEQQEAERRREMARAAELQSLRQRRTVIFGLEREVRTLQSELEKLADPRTTRQRLLVQAERLGELQAQQRTEEQRLTEASDRLKAVVGRLQEFSSLDAEIEEQRAVERDRGDEYERFLKHVGEAGQREARQALVDITRRALGVAREAEREIEERIGETASRYDAERHEALKRRHVELHQAVGEETKTRELVGKQLAKGEEELAYLRRREAQLAEQRAELDELDRVSRTVGFLRDTIRAAGPAVTETLLTNISQTANDIFAEILDDHTVELRWDRDYEVLVQRGPEVRKFAQLSGGEQMSAALAVRLALLKEMSDINFAFFDEPTQNMDGERRSNLADQIRQVRGFEQLIVISHDDTFEHHTDNLIRLHKRHEASELEAS